MHLCYQLWPLCLIGCLVHCKCSRLIRQITKTQQNKEKYEVLPLLFLKKIVTWLWVTYEKVVSPTRCSSVIYTNLLESEREPCNETWAQGPAEHISGSRATNVSIAGVMVTNYHIVLVSSNITALSSNVTSIFILDLALICNIFRTWLFTTC